MEKRFFKPLFWDIKSLVAKNIQGLSNTQEKVAYTSPYILTHFKSNLSPNKIYQVKLNKNRNEYDLENSTLVSHLVINFQGPQSTVEKGSHVRKFNTYTMQMTWKN